MKTESMTSGTTEMARDPYPSTAMALAPMLRGRLGTLGPKTRIIRLRWTRSFTRDLCRELESLCRTYLACEQLCVWFESLLRNGRIDTRTDGGPDLAPLIREALEKARTAMNDVDGRV